MYHLSFEGFLFLALTLFYSICTIFKEKLFNSSIELTFSSWSWLAGKSFSFGQPISVKVLQRPLVQGISSFFTHCPNYSPSQQPPPYWLRLNLCFFFSCWSWHSPCSISSLPIVVPPNTWARPRRGIISGISPVPVSLAIIYTPRSLKGHLPPLQSISPRGPPCHQIWP